MNDYDDLECPACGADLYHDDVDYDILVCMACDRRYRPDEEDDQ